VARLMKTELDASNPGEQPRDSKLRALLSRWM
jgi:hypothetical protein